MEMTVKDVIRMRTAFIEGIMLALSLGNRFSK